MHTLKIIVHRQINDLETIPAHRTFNTICQNIGVKTTKQKKPERI